MQPERSARAPVRWPDAIGPGASTKATTDETEGSSSTLTVETTASQAGPFFCPSFLATVSNTVGPRHDTIIAITVRGRALNTIDLDDGHTMLAMSRFINVAVRHAKAVVGQLNVDHRTLELIRLMHHRPRNVRNPSTDERRSRHLGGRRRPLKHLLDMRLELRPARKPVLASDEMQRVGQLHFRFGRTTPLEKRLGLVAQILEVGTRRKLLRHKRLISPRPPMGIEVFARQGIATGVACLRKRRWDFPSPRTGGRLRRPSRKVSAPLKRAQATPP